MIVDTKKSSWFSGYRRRVILITFIPALLFIANYGLETRAGVAKFYSQSCLGGWQNPQRAVGEPELGPGAKLEDFTDNNSAILRDSLSEIFCGDFKGDISPDDEPKKFRLKFSWLVDDGSLPKPPVTTIVGVGDFADQVDEIIDLKPTDAENTELTITDVPAESVEADKSEEVVSTEIPAEIPVENQIENKTESQNSGTTQTVEPVSPQESVPTIAPSSAETTSWWRGLISFAFATTTTEEKIDLPIILQPINETNGEVATSAAAVLAAAENIISPDDLLEIFYTTDSTTWQSLGRVNPTNWRDLVLDLPLTSWEDLSQLQISVRSLPRLGESVEVYLDSLWLEVDYLNPFATDLTEDEIDLLPRVDLPSVDVFLSKQKTFNADELPEFIINRDFPGVGSLEGDLIQDLIDETTTIIPEVATSSEASSTPGQLLNWIWSKFAAQEALAAIPGQARLLRATVYDSLGKPSKIKAEIREQAGTFSLNLVKPKRTFRPGKYTVRVEILHNRKVLVSSQDFYWGVLAINANQSVYAPGERGYLQFAVLDDGGHTICDADLTLAITGPSGRTLLSTESGTIARNNTCGANNVTDEPDYFSYFQFTSNGVYDLELTNLVNQHQIKDSILVREGDRLAIERIGATRINPFMADYTMRLKLTANENLTGTLTEIIPIEFQITDASGGTVTNRGTHKTIEWPVGLVANQAEEISYTYHAPPVSPQLYLLGPASFNSSGRVVFTEEREWQIAADTVCTSNVVSGNWSASGSWTNCGSSIPDATDTVVILNGHTITLDTDGITRTIDIQNGGTLNTDGNSRTLTLTPLPLAATVPFTLGATGTFTPGNSTVIINASASFATLFSGEITFYNLQFSPNLGLVNRTYNLGTTATTTVLNEFTIDPNKNGNGTNFTIYQHGPLVVGSSTNIAGRNNVLTTFNSGAQNITTGRINLSTNMTLNTYGSLVTVNATSSTLLTLNGAFNAGTSTVRFTPDADVTLNSATSTTYYNLELTPTLTGNRSYTFGSATTTVNNNLTINPTSGSTNRLTANLAASLVVDPTKTLTISGSGSGVSTLDTTSSNYTLSTGLIDIASAGTLTANSSTINITGTSGTLFTRSGTFNAGNSNVVFDGVGSPTLTSGAVTFYNLKTNTSSSTVGCSCVYTFGSGAVTVDNIFEINPSGNTVANTELTVRLGSGGLTTNATTTLTATPSTFNASSTLDTTTSNYSLTTGALNIAHASSTLLANSSTITVNGIWSNSGSFSPGGSTVTFTTATSTTINTGGTGSGRQFYNLTINKISGTARVIANHLDVINTLTITAGTLDINSKNIITTASISNSGTLQLLGDETVSSSPTNNSGSTVIYTATSSSRAIKDWTYHHMTVNGSGGTFTMSAAETFGGDINVSAGTLNTSNQNATTTSLTIASGATFTAGSSIIALNGTSGTLFTRGGTFNANTSTFKFTSDADVTLTSGTVTFNNLQATPSLSASRAYTFGSNVITIGGNFDINPTAGSSRTLTVNLGAAITVTGTTTVTGSASASSNLDSTASNHNLTSGRLSIETAGTVTARASTITLNGTTGPLFTRVGTFNANTSNVRFTSNASVTLTSGRITFYDLKASASLSGTNRTYTFGSGAIVVSRNFDINPTSTTGTPTLTVNLGAAVTVTGTTTVTGVDGELGDGNSVLDTTGSNYALSSGHIEVASRGTFNINSSTITLTGTNGTLITKSGTGVLNLSSGTVVVTSNADVQVTSGSFILGNLEITPILTSDRTHTFNDSYIEIGGTALFGPGTGQVIDPIILTVNLGEAVDFGGNGLELSPTDNAKVVVDTTNNHYSVSGESIAINSGGSFLSNNSYVVLIGDGITINGGYFDAFYTATGGDLDLEGGGLTITSGGYMVAPSTIRVAGNFSNSGTFTHNSGTVELYGNNQTISGSTNFYNLKKLDSLDNTTDLVLTFQANATTTISGLLTITGIDTNDRVNLVSSSPGTRWGLTVNGTFNINWAEATDSDASLGAMITPANTLDGGNNLNWFFDSIAIVVDGSTQAFPAVTPGGSVVATSSIITLTSSNQNGFVVTVYRSNGASPTMRLTTNNSLSIPDKTAWIPHSATTSAGNATASTTEAQTLQFRVRKAGTDTPNYSSAWWGSDDTTANALFAGFPSTAQNIVNRSTPATATTTITVLYNLAVPITQPSGSYTGDVIYTATVNP